MTRIPLTVADAGVALRSGELSSVELTAACFARADAIDGQVGSYVLRFDEPALAAARRADDDFAGGVDRGPFQGIPVGVKDMIFAAEGPTRMNSIVLPENFGVGLDSAVVARLRSAGAVITGKVSTSEFGSGEPDPDLPYPIPRNPWDLTRTPGGSSSGTGNGVAAGLFLAGLGSDGGGSIRVPAAYNGITGLRPSFGLVPTTDVGRPPSSVATAGPMARSARDCAAMLTIIAGYDPADVLSVDRPPVDYVAALDSNLQGVTVGVDSEHFPMSDMQPGVSERFNGALEMLRGLGARVVPISLPYFEVQRTALFLTMVLEAFAPYVNDLRDRWHDFGRYTRTNWGFGALIPAADYLQAQEVRRVGQQAVAEVFTSVDVVVTPTTTHGAATTAEMAAPVMPRVLMRSLTAYWSAVGSPALAVPIGFSDTGMPVSMQIAGPRFGDAAVLNVGDAYQTVTDWHLRLAPLLTEIT